MATWLALVLAVATALPAVRPPTVQPPSSQEQALDRLFTGRTPNQITDALAREEGDIALPDPVMPGARVAAGDALGRLTNTVCRSALIAVGRWVSVTPHLNADRSSLYSEWRLSLSQVLKARRLDAQPGAARIVYLRGGAMRFGERTVTVANRDFARGLEPGADFLVFASRIPDSDALVATAGFRIDEGLLRGAATRRRYPALDAVPLEAGLSRVREILDLTSGNPDCVGLP